MTMRFCPKCNSLLVPKSIGERFIIACKNKKCDFFHEVRAKPLVEEEKVKHPEKRGGGVLKKNILATYSHKCKKCGYDKAQIVDMGVFYSDEDNLIMLKCGKCGYSERVGRKTM